MCKGAEVGQPLFFKNDPMRYYLSIGKYSVSREDYLQGHRSLNKYGGYALIAP